MSPGVPRERALSCKHLIMCYLTLCNGYRCDYVYMSLVLALSEWSRCSSRNYFVILRGLWLSCSFQVFKSESIPAIKGSVKLEERKIRQKLTFFQLKIYLIANFMNISWKMQKIQEFVKQRLKNWYKILFLYLYFQQQHYSN